MNTPDSLLATLDHDNGDDVDQLTSFCYPMASFKLPTHYRVTGAPARSWWWQQRLIICWQEYWIGLWSILWFVGSRIDTLNTVPWLFHTATLYIHSIINITAPLDPSMMTAWQRLINALRHCCLSWTRSVCQTRPCAVAETFMPLSSWGQSCDYSGSP